MATLGQVRTNASTFVHGVGRPILMAWGASVVFDLAMIRVMGLNVLAMLNVLRVGEVTQSLLNQPSEWIGLGMMGLLVSTAFRKGLWHPVSRRLAGEKFGLVKVVFSAIIKVIPVIALQQVISLALALVSLICMALGLSFALFPQLLVLFALSPAIFILVTERAGFLKSLGLALRWSGRAGGLLFAAQSVGLVASLILGSLLNVAWAGEAGVAATVGAASLYLAVSWISWVAESAAFITVAEGA